MIRVTLLAYAAATLLISNIAFAESKYPEPVLGPNVERHSITIFSDGRALEGEIFRPKNLEQDKLVPTIVTSHCWGGDKSTAARYAAKFANAGFIALTFTHSSWGNSDGYLYVDRSKDDQPIAVATEIVDPIDWVQNVRSAVDYLEGEPNVDAKRIGAWGTSFGGGVMVANAIRDDRIAALVTQVAAFPSLEGPERIHAKNRAVAIARGDISPVPQELDKFPGLAGAPNLARFLQYQPMTDIEELTIPTLFIAAANEQLFKNEDHSEKAHAVLKAKGTLKTEYHVLPDIDHYGIYFGGYTTGSELALDWFLSTL